MLVFTKWIQLFICWTSYTHKHETNNEPTQCIPLINILHDILYFFLVLVFSAINNIVIIYLFCSTIDDLLLTIYEDAAPARVVKNAKWHGNMIISCERVRIWKEKVVAYFNVLTRHSSGDTDKTTNILFRETDILAGHIQIESIDCYCWEFWQVEIGRNVVCEDCSHKRYYCRREWSRPLRSVSLY
jgi:hypothetical protein